MVSKECMKKKYEKWLIEQAMQACPSLFPPGKLLGDHEPRRPDWLLKTDSETIGIEVTNLYQTGEGDFSPRQDEDFVEKVVRCAKVKYVEMGGDPVEVLVYPTSYDGGKRDKNLMVESLANFVKRHYRTGQTVNFNYRSGITVNSHEHCRTMACDKQCIGRCAETPEGFDYGNMWTPSELQPDGKWWSASSTSRTLPLVYKDVETAIKKKTGKRLSAYLTSADCVWLLIVIDLFPLSASLEIPRSVEAWKFSFGFDKVLLFSHEDGVLELGHDHRSVRANFR